jgi:aromatic-L-amino-acid/L-tryptophan decarboxylase
MPHMTPDEFRRHGREVVDWLADHMERLEELPVLSQVAPGDVRAALPAHPPETGEPFADVLADLDRVVLPGMTHWQHPSFFAYFPANTSGPSILGDLVSSGLGAQGMLWATSPALTELETHVLDWFAELLDLPERFRGNGVIQDSASSATLCALLAARERATKGASNREGVRGRLTVYASDQAHSSVEKAVRIVGLGQDNLRLVPVGPDRAMDVAALARLVEQDVADGAVPVMVVAAVGTTGTTAVDDVVTVAEVCARHRVWLHVDAAYAGVAAVAPELRFVNAGLDRADSWCTNPHKWLLTGFDLDTFYVADREALVGALTVLPEYLRNAASETGAVIDYRDWQVPLGRRFRALKLWFVLRWYGAEGLREHVRGHVALAAELAADVAADDRFELVGPHPFGLVCLRVRELDDDGHLALIGRVNASGRAYLTHTKVDGRVVLRVSIGSPTTERRHVAALWEQLRTEAGAEADA